MFFYTLEHLPIHVHGHYQGRESKAEFDVVNGKIVDIRFINVKGIQPLRGSELSNFKTLVLHEADNILKEWEAYFLNEQHIAPKIITRRIAKI